MRGKLITVSFDVVLEFPSDDDVVLRETTKPAKFRLLDEVDKDSLLTCKHAKNLVKAVPGRNGKGDVKELSNWKQMKDAIVYSDERNMANIKVIVDCATTHQAKAILLSVHPAFLPAIPVLVLNSELFHEFNKYNSPGKRTKVTFSPAVSTNMTMSMKDESNETPYGENNFDQDVSIPRESKSIEYTSCSTKSEKTREPYAVTSQKRRGEGKGQETNYTGVFKIFGKVKDLLFNAKAVNRDELEVIFAHDRWTVTENDYYIWASRILNRSKPTEIEMKEIFQQLQKFFSNHDFHDIDILILAFSMNVHLTTNYFGTLKEPRKQLFSSIMKVLMHINIESSGPKLYEQKQLLHDLNSCSHPDEVMLSFIQGNIREMFCHAKIEGFAERKLHMLLYNLASIVLYHSGMVQRKLVVLLLPYIQHQPFQDSSSRRQHAFLTLMDEVAFRSLSLSCQPTLSEFCVTFDSLRTENSVNYLYGIEVYQCVFEQLTKLIEKEYKSSVSDEDFLEQIIYVFRVLITAGSKPGDKCPKLVSKCINAFLQKHTNYNILVFCKIWDLVDIEHRHRELICGTIGEILERQIYHTTIEHVSSLLSHECCMGLHITGEIDRYTKKTVISSRRYSLEQKIVYLYHLSISIKTFMDHDHVNLISRYAEKVVGDDINSLTELFEVAQSNSHFFPANETESIVNNTIVNAFLNERKVKILYGANGNCCLKKLMLSIESEGTFLYCLTKKLIDLSVKIIDTVDKATSFYKANAMISFEIDSTNTIFKIIREKVIIQALTILDPQTFLDIASLTMATLEVIIDSEVMAKHSNHESLVQILKVADCWITAFNTDKVEYLEVEALSILYDEDKWNKINIFLSMNLPSLPTIAEKSKEFESLCESIYCCNFVSTDTQRKHSVLNLLEEYKVDTKLIPFVRHIITNEQALSSLARLIKMSKKANLMALREEQLNMLEFKSKYNNVFRTAAYFLGKNSIVFNSKIGSGTWTSLSFPEFLHKLSIATEELLKQLKCDGIDLFSSVGSILENVRVENLEHEFVVLQQCPTLDLNDSNKDQFLHIANLMTMSDGISNFVNCCKQFSFGCVTTDVMFCNLERISNDLIDKDTTATWTLNDIIECKDELFEILFPAPSEISEAKLNLTQYRPVMDFFSYLSLHSEIWALARDMKWFGEKGQTLFNEMYENVTNVLLADSESMEMAILDCLEPTIRLLNFVWNLAKEVSVVNMLQHIKSNADITKSESVRVIHNNLRVVQENITSIREWFDGGLDEMATIFVKFDAILKSGTYVIESNVLHLLQNDENRNNDSNGNIVLSGKGLNEFIRQLGFVKNDKHGMSETISTFIEQHHVIQKILERQLAAQRVGFDTSTYNLFPCEANPQAEEIGMHQTSSGELMINCQLWLGMLQNNYPISLLFWTEELRKIHSLMKDAQISDGKMRSLIYSVANVFDTPMETICFDSNRTWIEDILNDEIVVDNWLEKTAMFVELFHKHLGGSLSTRTPKLGSFVSTGMVLHTLQPCDGDSATLILDVICNIFKNRAPFSFEFFYCQWIDSLEKLEYFLKRTLLFPSCTFVLLNLEKLSSASQEVVVNFISKYERSDVINLHVVQLEESIVPLFPWVQSKVWRSEGAPCDSFNHLKSWISDIVLKQQLLTNISVISAAQCGSGKTRFIEEQIQKKLHLHPETQVGRICVHEKTSIKCLVHSLLERFDLSNEHNMLYIAIMVPLSSQYDELMKVINYFFQSMIITRSIQDAENEVTFYFGPREWDVYVELVGSGSIQSLKESLVEFIPVLAYSAVFPSIPTLYQIDYKARRVCTYLRAFDNGTIDRKFDPRPMAKQLMFVIDKSGSMNTQMNDEKNALDVAIDNAIEILSSHVCVGDVFGTMMFDHSVDLQIPLNQVQNENDRMRLRERLDLCRDIQDGGTSMYIALQGALQSLAQYEEIVESTWIVCLTDGVSDHKMMDELRQQIQQTSSKLHLIIVGVNLALDYTHQMRELSHKYTINDSKGLFVASAGEIESLKNAFAQVAARIPVSQTFELDGKLNDDECRNLINQYIPSFITSNDMLSQKFWIEFLYRRVKVFDQNEQFNYNESCDHLGSSLMKIMLDEAEQLLSRKHNKSWKNSNHEQLIYDFTNVGAPEFRLICTAPDLMPEQTRLKYTSLNLPGFHIPKDVELNRRETLDRYLSQAMDIPLIKMNDGVESLRCIDEHKFVLTLDFTMKLLNMHERVACQIPCIIEGETGVSKTALTKMYSILCNSSLKADAKKTTLDALMDIELELQQKALFIVDENDAQDFSVLERIQGALYQASNGSLSGRTELGRALYELLKEAGERRGPLFKTMPSAFEDNDAQDGETAEVLALLDWFSESILEETFYEINVDSSLCEGDVLKYFEEIQSIAKKVKDSRVMIIVFLDEVNTSSIMGLFKEIIIDHSFCGDLIEDNVVIVAACNPAGRQAFSHGMTNRENDLGKEWASGHYQVNELPETMKSLKWEYGSLDSIQEKDFIFRRMEMLGNVIPTYLRHYLTELIMISHETIREFAMHNIQSGLMRNTVDIDGTDLQSRAKSCVSLRDIQRVFSLFKFFSEDFSLTKSKYKESMYLTIAVVYYLKLDKDSRSKFCRIISQMPAEGSHSPLFQNVLDGVMAATVEKMVIPKGIAVTNGLKENIFMTVVCSLSFTPLTIIGPPGSSKTLSVNIVSDNMNGEESTNVFFRDIPRLSTFHYQCSRKSTSKEVASVFDNAIQRQEKVDPLKHKCLVFMDEAGLPEEDKESLKVLHYYLEGHMSNKAKVGFVAITNHILDAAKSNRCVSLLRQEPDKEEMMRIINGIMYDSYDYTVLSIQIENIEIPKDDFTCALYEAYTKLINDSKEMETFFGLRDLTYFLRYLQYRGQIETTSMKLPIEAIISGIEMNFNGVEKQKLHKIVNIFLSSLPKCEVIHAAATKIRQPIDVIENALKDTVQTCSKRYTLVIDETADDSIVRLLRSEDFIDTSQKCLFKLSKMPENIASEEINLVCGVKYAAQKGTRVVLSQTDTINESFYDLFNQNFRKVTCKDGTQALFANISVGGVSKRSKVSSSFHCIVHVRLLELPFLPAPFLNRFEKYRLRVKDMLNYKIDKNNVLQRVVNRSIRNVRSFVQVIGSQNLCGFCQKDTIDSYYLGLISGMTFQVLERKDNIELSKSFVEHLFDFFNSNLSICIKLEELDELLNYAKVCLPLEQTSILQQLLSKSVMTNPCTLYSGFMEVLKGKPETMVAKVIESLIEMNMTSKGISAIIALATPDSIFSKRLVIPPSLMRQYFHQEHFILKRFIERVIDGDSSKILLHTRSDSMIHRISSLKAGETFDKIKETVATLVYHETDRIKIECLYNLKSELLVRSTIEGWVNDDCCDIFLLIVDMNEDASTERVNYVRCCIDQVLKLPPKKTIMLLLHYPNVSFQTKVFYPALFLDNWHHHFLDSLGGESGSAVSVKELLYKVCVGSGEDGKALDIAKGSMKLLEYALKSIASWSLFYDDQLIINQNSLSSFQQRYHSLLDVIAVEFEGETVGDILSEKFASMWTESRLLKALKQASHSIDHDKSQLPITSCLCSILQDSMHQFLSSILIEMNTWKNFDILTDMYAERTEVRRFFWDILRKLPSLPFEELLLHRIAKPRMTRLPSSSFDVLPQFPFFHQISTFIEQVVKHAIITKKHATISELNHEEILVDAMLILSDLDQDDLSETVRNHGFKDIIFFCLETVDEDDALYEHYLDQYISWKLLCMSDSAVAVWFQNLLRHTLSTTIRTTGSKVILIHVLAHLHEIEILHLASIGSWPMYEEILLSDNDSNQNNNLDGIVAEMPFQSFVGLFAFQRFIHWFENHLIDLTTCDVRQMHWVSSFNFFLNNMGEILNEHTIDDSGLTSKLRKLTFLYILLNEKNVKADYFAKCMDLLYDSNISNEVNPTISFFIGILSDARNSEIQSRCIESLLLQFFSPIWISSITYQWEEDLNYFMTSIMTSQTIRTSERLVFVLIRNACCNRHCQNGFTSVLSFQKLKVLTSHLECIGISNFSDVDGKRMNLPRYFPPWLSKLSSNTPYLSVHSASHEIISKFFSENHGCIAGDTVEVVYDIVLAELTESLSGCESSEHLFIMLWKDLEIEMTLQQNEQSRLGRLRSHTVYESDDEHSLTGSSLALIMIEVRLLFFVLMVSYEIAMETTVAALSGAYSDLAYSMINQAMCVEHLCLQEIFFQNIIRIRGEGFLYFLFKSNTLFMNDRMYWTSKWREGCPLAQEEIEGSLRKAEEDLRDATNEENKKARDFLLCPRCRQPFGILAQNCGQFVCGRADTHITPQNGPMGCGGQFSFNQALPYNIDHVSLDLLREDVERKRQQMDRFSNSSQLWHGLETTTLPLLVSSLSKSEEEQTFLPTSFAVNIVGNASNLIRHLVRDRTKINQFVMLPDLIEFYLWLHSTFRFLVTHDQACDLRVEHILEEDTLKKRFDNVRVNHILGLWSRVKVHLDDYLEQNENHVYWDCERIALPLTSASKATLIMFLSASSHPTEGYDFLFMIISNIIEQYNNFILRLNECKKECNIVKIADDTVSPNTILPGNHSALSISALRWINSIHLHHMIEQYRRPKLDVYDIAKLEEAVCKELSSCEYLIDSPIKHLRSQFQFRCKKDPTNKESSNVHQSSEGYYFVHAQDLQLFDDCKYHLNQLGYQRGDQKIKHLLATKLNVLDYEQLRSVLVGSRTIFQQTSERDFDDSFDSLEQLISVLLSLPIIDTVKTLESFGFSVLPESQVKTIMSLALPDLASLIDFVGYQLASEGYSFTNLPLSMNSPLEIDHRVVLRANVDKLCEMKDYKSVIDALQEFKVDILSFYQSQIRQKCLSSNQNMCTYLEEQNFCDDSDIIFRVLPPGIKVRNYVSLQQELYQLGLGLTATLYNRANAAIDDDNDEEEDKTEKFSEEDKDYAKIRRGKCWLWRLRSSAIEKEDVCFEANDEYGIDLLASSYEDSSTKDLWFEVSKNRYNKIYNTNEFVADEVSNHEEAINAVDKRNVKNRDGKEGEAAIKLQQWWSTQKHFRKLRSNNIIGANVMDIARRQNESAKIHQHGYQGISFYELWAIVKGVLDLLVKFSICMYLCRQFFSGQ